MPALDVSVGRLGTALAGRLRAVDAFDLVRVPFPRLGEPLALLAPVGRDAGSALDWDLEAGFRADVPLALAPFRRFRAGGDPDLVLLPEPAEP